MTSDVGEHISGTDELSLETIKQRAVRGVAALTGRTFLLQLVAFGSVFLLTIFLNPEQYGVFFLVSAVVNFFAYFSDIGLAAALIQKRDQPTTEELKTTFTTQQGLVVALFVIILATTPLWKVWYGLSQQSVYLLWALGFSLILSSLKTIPSVLLERKLEFHKLVVPQIVETFLFYLVAVILAWRGLGIVSFTVAVLVRGISGLVVMYWLKPWKPGFALSGQPLRRLLRFGLPYQANTLLAVVKDDGMTIILGGIIGPAGVGLLGWALKWAQAPLRFFMDSVIKVTFPTYARLQDDKQELSRLVSRSVFFICLMVFPSLVGLVMMAPALTEVIPKYEKWQPALLALTLLSVNVFFAAITTPLTNMLNAIGKITVTFRLMIMWTLLTWLFVPSLSWRYHLNGAALGFALVGISSIIAIWWTLRFVRIDLLGSVGQPFLASVGMGIFMFLVGSVIPLNIFGMSLLFASGVLSYALFLYVIVGPPIIVYFKTIYAAFKKSQF